MSRTLTPRQRGTVTFVVTVDIATALSIATYAKSDPAQYAAGLLMRTCSTAAAIGCTPADVPPAAAAHSIIAAHKGI